MISLRRVPFVSLCAVWALATVATPSIALGFDDPPSGAPLADDGGAPQGAGQQSAGPVRMARFSYVGGDVTWRPDADSSWAPATVNLPLRQGIQVFVPHHSRAEIQFDDGSVIRLGAGAMLTLQTMYSDADGEFTEIKLTDGLVTLKTRNTLDLYQFDTPFVSVKTTGPSEVRVGIQDREEVAVKRGTAKIDGPQGQVELNSGSFLDIADANAAFQIQDMPADDAWEQWNAQRDRMLDSDTLTKQYAPPNVALASPDLDSYGAWQNVAGYGQIWFPTVTAGWRPYHAGHWVWCDPFGWTWVGEEPWGWAPYHYGSWIYCNRAWGWSPGPACQYWSPAVVSFCEWQGHVSWYPLAPHEVIYPSTFGIGFAGGNWSLFFAIGACGVYYPHDAHFCAPVRWDNGWVNRWRPGGFGVDRFRDPGAVFAANHNSYGNGAGFAPENARFAGGSLATTAAFRGGGSIEPVGAGQAREILTGGRMIGAPGVGQAPMAGPSMVRPTPTSLSPSRQLATTMPAQQVAQRPVYHPTQSPAVSQPGSTGVSTTVRPAGPGAIGSGTPTGRPLSDAEQSVIKARASVGMPARVRYPGDGVTTAPGSSSSSTGASAGRYPGSYTPNSPSSGSRTPTTSGNQTHTVGRPSGGGKTYSVHESSSGSHSSGGGSSHSTSGNSGSHTGKN